MLKLFGYVLSVNWDSRQFKEVFFFLIILDAVTFLYYVLILQYTFNRAFMTGDFWDAAENKSVLIPNIMVRKYKDGKLKTC